jgi:hypothetical protein
LQFLETILHALQYWLKIVHKPTDEPLVVSVETHHVLLTKVSSMDLFGTGFLTSCPVLFVY